MLKTGQVRSCQGPEKRGRHVVAVHNPHNIVFINFLSKTNGFVSEHHLDKSKNINFLLVFSHLPRV